MNHHFQWHFMRPLNAAAQSGQPGDARPPSRLRRVQRTQGDLTLGAVAFGALLLLLAWVVTGIDLFAVPVLLIAAASIAVSFTIGPRFPVNIDDGGRLGAFTAVRRLQHHASHRRWQLGRPQFCRDASPHRCCSSRRSSRGRCGTRSPSRRSPSSPRPSRTCCSYGRRCIATELRAA